MDNLAKFAGLAEQEALECTRACLLLYDLCRGRADAPVRKILLQLAADLVEHLQVRRALRASRPN